MIVNNILKEAIDNNIQDITFFPHGEDYEVAFRTADVKQVHDFISSEDADALFGHIKFIAEMDVTEKRCSQVRTCDYQLDDGRVITIRISTIVNFQELETMSIRLIHVNERRISLSEFDSSCMEELLEQVRIPGLHVITGPAGVGKTTLAYSLLTEAFKESKVVTIERHVEIKEMSFYQLQVNKANGMELKNLVTFVLRSNPDVLFIGEANTQEEVEVVLMAVSAGLSVVTTAYQDDFSIPHDVLEMKQGKDGKRNVALINYKRRKTMTDTIKIDAFDRFMAVSHFDEEMAEAHTPTEDAIHNWIVDHQEDDELIAGILKHLDRTIKDAMAYCIRKASKSDYRNGQGAMVDDATVFSWVKEYFTAEKVETKSVVGKMTTGSKKSTKQPTKKPKKKQNKSLTKTETKKKIPTKKIPEKDEKQLDLFSDLSVEEGEF